MLAEGQFQVGDLVMGADTDFTVLDDFNPWTRETRADEGADRAWGDGSWSGAEWTAEATLPMRVRVRNQLDGSRAGWLAAHQRLVAAFAPRHEDIELRWVTGGVEYLMRGRPRLVDPEAATIRRGYSITRCAFAALDPTIYSGTEHSVTLGLPSTVGGLTAPITLPATVGAVVTAGRRTIVNAGTKPTGLRLRVDGPVLEPRVSVLTAAGAATVRVWLTLAAGQWLDIDTAARTVYLNGTASRRGLTSVEGVGWPVLPGSGSAEIAFDSPVYNPDAQLTAFWRDSWH